MAKAVDAKQILTWFANGKTGSSSEAMALCAAGVKAKPRRDEHPYDAADFNRCLLLVNAVPSVLDAFPRIAKLSKEWRAITDHWEELRDTFINEAGWNWSAMRTAPKTDAMVRDLLRRARGLRG